MTPTTDAGEGGALLNWGDVVLGRCMKVLTSINRVFLIEAVLPLVWAKAGVVASVSVKKDVSCAALVAAHDDYEHLDTRSLSTLSTVKNL